MKLVIYTFPPQEGNSEQTILECDHQTAKLEN